MSPEDFYTSMTRFSFYYLYIGCAVLVAAFIQVKYYQFWKSYYTTADKYSVKF